MEQTRRDKPVKYSLEIEYKGEDFNIGRTPLTFDLREGVTTFGRSDISGQTHVGPRRGLEVVMLNGNFLQSGRQSQLGITEGRTLQFPDSTKTISRLHGHFYVKDEDILYTDLSTNGTYYRNAVSGNRVLMHSGEGRHLKPNDRLYVGEYVLTVMNKIIPREGLLSRVVDALKK